MEDLAREGKLKMFGRGYWVSVSKAMGATRTPKQCQSKWCVLDSFCNNILFMQFYRSESLEGKVKNEGKTRRWQEDDSYILIYKYVTSVRDICTAN